MRFANVALLVALACGGGGSGGTQCNETTPKPRPDQGLTEDEGPELDEDIQDEEPDATGPDKLTDVAIEGVEETTFDVVDAPDAVDEDAANDAADEGGIDAPQVIPPLCNAPVPFSPGPYGVKPYDHAAPFTLPTLAGDFDFQASWTGCESHVFLQYAEQSSYAKALWKSLGDAFLKESPRLAHLFFQSVDVQAADQVAAQKGIVDAALAKVDAETASWWAPRMHYVPVQVKKLTGWVYDALDAAPYYVFAVDRFQRLREVGLLFHPGSGLQIPEMKYVGYQVEYFDFEYDREVALAAETATVVPVWSMATLQGDAFVEVTLPDAAAMAGFDTMLFDLGLYCPGRTDNNCPEWDRIVSLYLCDKDAPDKCDREIGRWITTYHREGRWVTDVSGMLALVADGGTRRVRFATQDPYDADLKIRLSNRGKGTRPFQALPLWNGGVGFNLDYNAAHPPIEFEPPEGTKKAEIYALITGHGFGNDVANCAEFCNHTHHFQLNGGPEHVKDHPEAGTWEGCAQKVGQGVVPDQYGTWPFGRGGWCPGLDVAPFVADVTQELVSGKNTITYRGLFEGKDYDPQPVAQPQGFGAIVYVTSYLVFSK
jgi:hypothetical protein